MRINLRFGMLSRNWSTFASVLLLSLLIWAALSSLASEERPGSPKHTVNAVTVPTSIAAASDIPDMSYDQILLLGDSLTDWSMKPNGWGLQLTTAYNRKADIKVRAVAGLNSWNLRHMMPSILSELNPAKVKLITLLIGTNDATVEAYNQHVDVSDYKDHVAAILKDIQRALPNARVIVMTPPPLGFVESTIIAKGSIMRYRDACIDAVLALKPSFKNLEFLNLWDVFMPNGEYKQPNWNPDTVKQLFYDGVHFGDEGASLLFHGLMNAIKSHWPELSPDALPTKYPSPMFLPPAKSKNVEELKKVLFKEARPVSSNTVKATVANSTSAATLPDLSYDKIILFGDSLTEYGSSDEDGWVLQLQQRYARKMAVENHGYGGYTSYWLKFAIPSFLSESLPARIKLVVLWIGTNDSALKGQSNQHVPAEKYKQYVKEMVNTTLAVAKDARILIITPPPIGSTLVFSYYTFDSIKLYRNTCIEAFSDLKESVGASVRQNLLLLDTWDLLVPNKAYEEPLFDPSSLNDWFKDGLHFSAKGHAKVLEAIVTAIGNNWPNLSADNVPEHLPRFNTGPSNDENNDGAVRKWLFG